jgi:ribonuclease HI
MNKIFQIYTDGSSLGNPGPAGWSMLAIENNNKIREYGGNGGNTTNSEMEIYAFYFALNFIIKNCTPDDKVEIFCDSEYVVKAYNQWLSGWSKKNWQNSKKEEIAHKKYWEIIDKIKWGFEKSDDLNKRREVNLRHIYAHKGHLYNERVDVLAKSFAMNKPVNLYNGSYKEYH